MLDTADHTIDAPRASYPLQPLGRRRLGKCVPPPRRVHMFGRLVFRIRKGLEQPYDRQVYVGWISLVVGRDLGLVVIGRPGVVEPPEHTFLKRTLVQVERARLGRSRVIIGQTCPLKGWAVSPKITLRESLSSLQVPAQPELAIPPSPLNHVGRVVLPRGSLANDQQKQNAKPVSVHLRSSFTSYPSPQCHRHNSVTVSNIHIALGGFNVHVGSRDYAFGVGIIGVDCGLLPVDVPSLR